MGVGGEGVSSPGGTFTGAANSSCKCISTTPIGAPIYIWPRAAIPPSGPPLERETRRRYLTDYPLRLAARNILYALSLSDADITVN